MNSLDTKYYRNLKGFDFDNINKNTFQTLIKSGIFDQFELSETYQNEEDYFVSDDDKMNFGSFYIHNKKEYHLKKEVISEMIYVKNWMLNGFYDSDIEQYIDDIAILIEQEFITENKIKIIEDNYKKYFSQIVDKTYYPLYRNNSKTRGYESWEDYVYFEFFEDQNFDFLAKFLKGEFEFLPAELDNNWKDYFIFSGISDYCEKTKNEILNIKMPDMNEINNENSGKKRDMSFRLSYFEKLMKLTGWDDLSPNLKGNILTHLFGDHHTNIRNYYLALAKDKDGKFKTGRKWEKEQNEAEEIIKNLLG